MEEPLDQRVQIVIGKTQLRAIDDWRRRQDDHLPSRSEAIRTLLRVALKKVQEQSN